MNRHLGALLAPALIVACSGPSSAAGGRPSVQAPPASPPSAATEGPTSAGTDTASAAPASAASADASPTAFRSPLYKYTVTLPAGWAGGAAMLPWNGKSQSGHEEPDVDKFGGPSNASAWAFAGPTSLDLARFAKDRIEANSRDHSDNCPAQPEVSEPIEIGGETGAFLAWNCGILINQALIVRKGTAYAFLFRDFDVHAATDPNDRALFEQLLDSVTFPN